MWFGMGRVRSEVETEMGTRLAFDYCLQHTVQIKAKLEHAGLSFIPSIYSLNVASCFVAPTSMYW